MPGDLDKLAAAFRDNPRSTAFVQYGEALMQHSRGREAIDVLRQGLSTHPDNLPGRLLLGRAHMMVHEWKEAQGELVKVVKLDREHQEGFRLLGEVLLRRNDFERALPILQQAQNLDPADARVLSMLKRCRDGRPLDPPPPIPQPRSGDIFDEETNVADKRVVDAALARMEEPSRPKPMPPSARSAPPPPPSRTSRPPPPPLRGDPTDEEVEADLEPLGPGSSALGRMPIEQRNVRQTGGYEERPVARRRDEGDSLRSSGRFTGQPGAAVEDPFAPMDGDALRQTVMPRGERAKATAAPNKQVENASEAMRRSAAMGEDFLNQLLGGGLLSVPNVEARGGAYDVSPDKRWGRSARRAFFFLWVVLVLGVGGGGGWYMWQKQRRDRDVAQHVATARDRMQTGSAADFSEAQKELEAALDKHPTSLHSLALLSEARAIPFYVFGQGKYESVDAAVVAASQAFKTKGEDELGIDSLLKARIAKGMAMLDKAQDPQGAIAEIRADLDRGLKANPEDGTLLWLDGELRRAIGDREGAKQSFLKADEGGKGPPIARISLGDLELDDGDAQAALASYDAALQRASNHPLALVGRALARVDRSEGGEAAMHDLNVGLAETTGFRSEGWKHLAMAALLHHLEDYKKAAEELDKAGATSLGEPRFVARLAMLRLDQGRIGDAERLRQRVRYYSSKPGQDPLLSVLDAEILLARGYPEQAIAAVGNAGGVRALMVRGRGYLDMPAPQPKDARLMFGKALEIAPGDWRPQVYDAFARVVGDEDSRGAMDALQKAGRARASGVPRYLEGEALLLSRQTSDAKRAFESSLQPDIFNPLAYRAQYRLAEIVRLSSATEAEPLLRKSLEQSPRYLPARSLLGRVLAAQQKWGEAKAELAAVAEAGASRWEDEMALGTVLANLSELEAAKSAFLRAREKGAPQALLLDATRAASPALAEEIGLDAPRERPSPRKKRGR